MKCIILAGGHGTRLGPCTVALSKHMLPVYDKPMIYYPLSVAMLAGLRDILIITSAPHQPLYQQLLGDGVSLGLRLSYAIQDEPNGIAEALIIGQNFIGTNRVCLMLGDNIFYGHGLPQVLQHIIQSHHPGAYIFAYHVANPHDYGVLQYDSTGHIQHIVEKPTQPPSHYAVPGLYFYDHTVIDKALNCPISEHGYKEITTINNMYAALGQLHVHTLGRGFTWFDTGQADQLLDASAFIAALERHQNIKIACLEEIAYRQNWINRDTLQQHYNKYKNSSYGAYLGRLLYE